MTTNPGDPRSAPRIDPWPLLAAAAALLPLWQSFGAPLGEPAADDFDFLHHALFGPASLFDGGGALVYWRPPARRRLPTALLAMLAALLCKELALVVAVLLPFAPEPATGPRRNRARWLAAMGGLVLMWAAIYVIVLRSAHLMVQSQLEGARPPLLLRLVWAFRSALQDGFGVAGAPWYAAIAVLALVALVAIVSARGANRPRAWLGFGALWFALATVPLAETYPVWG